MSSSPNNNNNSDQEDHDESAEPSDDGETIEVDPLTFCQPEMISEGQGEFEESIEEHDSDDENNEYSQFIQETNIPQNDDEFGEAEGYDPNAPNEEAEEPLVSPKKIPSVQLTAVNKKRESSERFEKENTSVPKVTITPIGSSQSSSPNKKEDPMISLNRKRKIENDFINSTIEKNVLLNKLPRTEAVLDHPIELRKLLFGDLAQEMCITVSRPGTNWKKELSPLDFDTDSSEVHRFSFGRNSSSTNGHSRVLKLLRQHGDSARSSMSQSRSTYSRNYTLKSNTVSPEPTPVVQENSSVTKPTSAITQSQLEEAMASGLLTNFLSSHSILGGGADVLNTAQKAVSGADASNSKPPAKFNKDLIDPEKGIFEDPETGAIRYRCRNGCGVTLASNKGRRKHEKRHCPKSSGEDKDAPTSSQQTSFVNSYPSTTPSPIITPSINISPVAIAKNPVISRTNSGFKCRFCGQLLTTLEGCKLHEKIQHANEISLSAAVALSSMNGSHV